MTHTLLDEISSELKLEVAWEKVKSGKNEDVRRNSKGYDGESIESFSKNIKANLSLLQKQLRNSTYKCQPFLGFPEKKKSGNFRLIAAPAIRDRVVQTAILIKVQEFYPEIRNGSSFCLPKIKGKKRVSFIDAFGRVIKQVRLGNTFVFESDIESFFDRVDKEALYIKVIAKLAPDKSLNSLIRQVIHFTVGNLGDFSAVIAAKKLEAPLTNQGLCQGSPLSPLFANIYLVNFDKALNKLFPRRYVRYVDDFLIMCKTAEETEYAYKNSVELLKMDSLSLPPVTEGDKSKTKLRVNLSQGDTVNFLGFKLSKNGIVPSASISQIKSSIDSSCYVPKKIRRALKFKKKDAGPQDILKVIEQRLNGYLGSYGYFHTTELISEINEYIKVKNIQSKQGVKPIIFNKRVKPLISLSIWKSLLDKKSSIVVDVNFL